MFPLYALLFRLRVASPGLRFANRQTVWASRCFQSHPSFSGQTFGSPNVQTFVINKYSPDIVLVVMTTLSSISCTLTRRLYITIFSTADSFGRTSSPGFVFKTSASTNISCPALDCGIIMMAHLHYIQQPSGCVYDNLYSPKYTIGSKHNKTTET